MGILRLEPPSHRRANELFHSVHGAKTLLFMALVKAVSVTLGGCLCGLFWPLVNDVRKERPAGFLRALL